MQIHTSIQPNEYKPSFEKKVEKNEVKIQPEEKIQNELKENVEQENSTKMQELKTALEETNILLTFSQDEDTQTLVVKLVDKITGDEIRQIPNEVSLKLLAVNAKLQGNFLDKKLD